MNVIEKYAKLFSELKMDENLFLSGGPELCPAEGTRTLLEYAQGSEAIYQYLNAVVVKQLICKNAIVNGEQELHGILVLEIDFKVNEGEAKMAMAQVLHAKNDLIIYLNSFWDLKHFNELCEAHPELKQMFERDK